MPEAVLKSEVFDELKALGWTETEKAPTSREIVVAARKIGAPKNVGWQVKGGWLYVPMQDAAAARKDPSGLTLYATPEEARAACWKTYAQKAKG